MSLTLHLHPLSSFCWKALIAFYENDTPFTPHIIADLGNPTERAALQKLWPIGKFRCCATTRGTRTVPESSVIIEYLDRHYPGDTKFVSSDADLALQTRCATVSTISTCTCRCRRSSETGSARPAKKIRTASKRRGRNCAHPTP